MDGNINNNNNRAARFPVLRAFPSRTLFQKTDNRTGALPTRHHKIPRLLQLAAHIPIWAWPAITFLSLSLSLSLSLHFYCDLLPFYCWSRDRHQAKAHVSKRRFPQHIHQTHGRTEKNPDDISAHQNKTKQNNQESQKHQQRFKTHRQQHQHQQQDWDCARTASAAAAPTILQQQFSWSQNVLILFFRESLFILAKFSELGNCFSFFKMAKSYVCVCFFFVF